MLTFVILAVARTELPSTSAATTIDRFATLSLFIRITICVTGLACQRILVAVITFDLFLWVLLGVPCYYVGTREGGNLGEHPSQASRSAAHRCGKAVRQ